VTVDSWRQYVSLISLHNHMLHERNIVLTMKTVDAPHVPNSDRIRIDKLSDTFTSVSLTYGFMETPNIEQGLAQCRRRGLSIDSGSTFFSFHVESCGVAGEALHMAGPYGRRRGSLFPHFIKRLQARQ
jgi:K+ transporter